MVTKRVKRLLEVFEPTGWLQELHLNGSLYGHGIQEKGEKIGYWNYYYPTVWMPHENIILPIPPIGQAVGANMCNGNYNRIGKKEGIWIYFKPDGSDLMTRFYINGKVKSVTYA